MFGIGGFELFLILLFAFLIFGPDKLPALAKTVGQAIAKFRDAQAEMTSQLKVDELVNAATGAKAPQERSAKPPERAPGAGGAGTASAPAPKRSQSGVPAEPDAPADGAAGEERPLSFSERKARYERERKAQATAQAADEGGDR